MRFLCVENFAILKTLPIVDKHGNTDCFFPATLLILPAIAIFADIWQKTCRQRMRIRSSNANSLSGETHCCLSYAPECLAWFCHCPNYSVTKGLRQEQQVYELFLSNMVVLKKYNIFKPFYYMLVYRGTPNSWYKLEGLVQNTETLLHLSK